MDDDYKVTDRGFKHWEPTITSYNTEVRIYESLAAMGPHIWMALTQNPYSNLEPSETHAHMSLEEAIEIHSKLGAAIAATKEAWGYVEGETRKDQYGNGMVKDSEFGDQIVITDIFGDHKAIVTRTEWESWELIRPA